MVDPRKSLPYRKKFREVWIPFPAIDCLTCSNLVPVFVPTLSPRSLLGADGVKEFLPGRMATAMRLRTWRWGAHALMHSQKFLRRGKEALFASRKPVKGATGVSADPTRFIAASIWKMMALLSGSLFLAPFLGAFFRMLVCQEVPSAADRAEFPHLGSYVAESFGGAGQCFQGAHLALVLISIILAAGLMLVAGVYWVLLVTHTLQAPFPFGGVTPTYTLLMNTEDVVFASLACSVFMDTFPKTLTVGIMAAKFAALTYPYILRSDAMTFAAQDAMAARFFASMWPIMCALLGTLFESAEIGPLVLFGLPIVALGGFFVSQARRAAVLAAPLDKLTSEAAVGVWAQYRYMIAARRGAGLAYWGLAMLDASGALQADGDSAGQGGKGGRSRAAGGASNEQSSLLGNSRVAGSTTLSSTLGSRAGGGGTVLSSAAGSVFNGLMPGEGGEQGQLDEAAHLETGGAEDEALMEQKQYTLDEAAGGWLGSAAFYRANALTAAPRRRSYLQEAEQAYNTLLGKFPSSYMAALRGAMFYATSHVRASAYMELRLLSQAWRLSEGGSGSPGLNVAVHIIHRRLYLQHTGSAASSAAISGARRLLFERHLSGARAAEVAGYRIAASVWAELARAPPDLGTLHSLAIAFRKHRSSAEYHFRRMLALNGNSPEVHRAFAAFLSEQLHDDDEAAEHLNKAEKLEAIVQASSHAKVARFEMLSAPSSGGTSMDAGLSIALSAGSGGTSMDDSIGVLLLSGGSLDAGAVLDANGAACRLFGGARSELVGMAVTRLLPPPLGQLTRVAVHKLASRADPFLYRWTHLLVMRLSGEIVPVTLMLQEAPPAATGPPEPRFSVLVRSIKLTGSNAIAVVAIDGDGGAQDGSTVFSAGHPASRRTSSASAGGGGHMPSTPSAAAVQSYAVGAPPQFNLDGGQTWALGGGQHGERGPSDRIASMVSSGGVLSPPPNSEQFFSSSARGMHSARDHSMTGSPVHTGLARGLNPLGHSSARSGDGGVSMATDGPKESGSATWAAGTASMHALLGLDVGEMTGQRQHVQVWMPHIMRKLRARRLRKCAHRFALAMVSGLGTGYVEHEHLHGGFMSQADTAQTAESIQQQSFALEGSRLRLRSAELVRLLQSTGADGTDQVTDDALSDDVRVTVQALPSILPDGTIADVQGGKQTVYCIITMSSLSGGVVDSSGGYDLNALSDLDDSDSQNSFEESADAADGTRSASGPGGGSPTHKGASASTSSLTAEMLLSAESGENVFGSGGTGSKGGRRGGASPTGSSSRRASQESNSAAISGGRSSVLPQRPGIAAMGRMRSDSVDVMADTTAGSPVGRPPMMPRTGGGTKPKHVGGWSTPGTDVPVSSTSPGVSPGSSESGAFSTLPLQPGDRDAGDSKAVPAANMPSERVMSSDSDAGVLAVSSGDSAAAAAAARGAAQESRRRGGLKASAASDKYAAGGGPVVDTVAQRVDSLGDAAGSSDASWEARMSGGGGSSPFAGGQRRKSSAAGLPVRFVSRRGSGVAGSGSPSRAARPGPSNSIGDAASTAGSSVWSGATHSSQLKRITVKALQSKTRLLREVLDSQSAGDLAPVRLTQRIFIVWTVALVLFCFVGGVSYWLSFQDLMLKHTESLWQGGDRMRYMLQTRSLLVSAGEFTKWGIASNPFHVYIDDVGLIKAHLSELDEAQLFDARELVDFSPQQGNQVAAFTRTDKVHAVSFFTLELDGLTAYGDLYAAFVAGLVGPQSAAGAGVRINSKEPRTAAFDDIVLGLLGGGGDDGTTEQHAEGTVVTSPLSVTQAGQLIQVELGVFVNSSLNSSAFLVSGSEPSATAYVFNTATTVLDAYNATILAKAQDAEAFFNYMWLQDVSVLLAAMLAPSLFMLARSSFTASDLHHLRFEPLATMLFLPQDKIKELSSKALEQFRSALGREDLEGGPGGGDGDEDDQNGAGDNAGAGFRGILTKAGPSKSLTPLNNRSPGPRSPFGASRWSRARNLDGARYHTDEGRFFAKAFAVISTPLLAVVLYITVVFSLEASLLQSLSQQSQRMYASQQLAVHASLYRTSVEDAMFSHGFARETAVDLARQRAVQSRYYLNLLLHGGDVSLFKTQAANWVQGPSISRAGLGDADANQLEENACTAVAALTAGTNANAGSLGALARQHAAGCRSVSGGLFTFGLEQAMYRYLGDGSVLLSALSDEAVNSTMPELLDPASTISQNATWWSADLAIMLRALSRQWVQLEEVHLRHSLGRLSAVVHDMGTTALQNHRTSFHIANIVCAVVIPMCIAALLWPLVSYLGESLLAARGLLLLVAPATVHEVPELKRLIVSLLKEYTQARKYTKWWKDHDVAAGRSAKHARGGNRGGGGISSASLYSDGVYSAKEG